jgi:hypothetical protein
MDVRLVRDDNHSPELGLVEHELECQPESFLHVPVGQDSAGGEVDQGPPGC